MGANERRKIEVYGDWVGLDGPALIGILFAEKVRGKEVLAFEYDDAWLHSPYALELDPELGLYEGPQYLQDEAKANFGLFLDSAPDRWGRVLMKRNEALRAREEDREPRPFFETDFLLGVSDQLRIGGLRFKTDPQGPFLYDDRDLTIPPWTSLRELERSSRILEEEGISEGPKQLEHLKKLLTPGSSLGGARPKASVSDPDGRLWVAKFPSRSDSVDVGAWEAIVHELARNAGIRIPEIKAERFSGAHHTFLSKRFDRTDDRQRVHFASAMTLLGYRDGDDHTSGASYLELAEFLMRQGEHVERELEELWRRIVFNICVANTDDHLRNHGFLLGHGGWTLAPAYDLNPDMNGRGLSLNISESDNALDLDLAMEVSEFFRLSGEGARKIMEEVKGAVRAWKELAERYGIPRSERELMEGAFGRSGE